MGMADDAQQYGRWIAQIDRRAEYMETAAIDCANQALKALFLLNGGGCLALLTFLGATFAAPDLTPDKASVLAAIIHSLTKFGLGAGLAVTASCLAYLTNSAFANGLMMAERQTALGQRQWQRGKIFKWLTILLALASLGSFFVGIWSVHSALK
jgi:hypothetical protein